MVGKMAMALLGGTSLGAALMFLFDPKAGKAHRQEVKKTAEKAYGAGVKKAGEVRETAKEKVVDWRGKLSEGLLGAARVIAPAGESVMERGRYRDDMELNPVQSMAAVALARHSRELHGEAREAYARARDMYYDALVDLDLARGRKLKEEKKIVKKGEPMDYLTIGLVTAGSVAAVAATMIGTRLARRR